MADIDFKTELQIEGLRDRVAAGDQLVVGVNATEGANPGDAHAPGGVIDGSANLGSAKPGSNDTPGGGGRGGGGSGENQEHHCKLVAGFMGKKDVAKSYTETSEIFRRNDLCDDPCEVPEEERNRTIQQDVIWQPVIPIAVDSKTPPRQPPFTPPDEPPSLVPPPTPTPDKPEKPTPTGGGGGAPRHPRGPHIEPDKKSGKSVISASDPCKNNKSQRRNNEGNRENICKFWYPFRDGSGRANSKGKHPSWFKTEPLGDGQSVITETDGRSIFQGTPAKEGGNFLDNLATSIECIKALIKSKGLDESIVKGKIIQCQGINDFKLDGVGGIDKLKEISEKLAKCLSSAFDNAGLEDKNGKPLSSFINDILKCLCKAFISNKQNLGAGAAQVGGANVADVPDTMELGSDITPPTYVNSDGRTKDIIKSPGNTRAEISEALNGPNSFVFEKPTDLASFEGENQPIALPSAGIPIAANAVGDKGCPCTDENLKRFLMTKAQMNQMLDELQKCVIQAFDQAKSLIKASTRAEREGHRQARRNKIKNRRAIRNERRRARKFNSGFSRLMKQGFGATSIGTKPSTAAEVKQALIATGLPQFAPNNFPLFVSGGESFDGTSGKNYPFKTDIQLADLPSSSQLEENPDNIALEIIENNPAYDNMLDVIATDGSKHIPEVIVGTSGLSKSGISTTIRRQKCIPKQFITKFIQGFQCSINPNLCRLLFGKCNEKIAGAINLDDITGLTASGKKALKNGSCTASLADWNSIFSLHKGRINNGLSSNSQSIFKAIGGKDGFVDGSGSLDDKKGFGGLLRNSKGGLKCSSNRDLRGSSHKIKNFFKLLKKKIAPLLSKYLKTLDEKCLKKLIKEKRRREQAKRLGNGKPVNNNGNPDRKNRKQKKKTKKPVKRKIPKGKRRNSREQWLALAKALQRIRRRSSSVQGNIPIYDNLAFFEGTQFFFDDEAINDINNKTDEDILDNFMNNLVPETLMPGATFAIEEPETYSIESNLIITDDLRIYLVLTLGSDYGTSEIFAKIMDHYHAQMKMAVALWNETVADSFPEAVIGRGVGLFATSMSLQANIHSYPSPPPINFLLPDGLPLSSNQFGLLVTMPALQSITTNLAFTSSELSAFRALTRLVTRWTKAFIRNYESLMGATARIFIEGIDPVPTGAMSLPTKLTNVNKLSDKTDIKIDSQLVSDTTKVIVEYSTDFGDAYAGTINGGYNGLDVKDWGKMHSAMLGALQNLTLESFDLSTTDIINQTVFGGVEALTKGLTIDIDNRIENWIANTPPYSDTNTPRFSFTTEINFVSSVPYDSNYTPGTNGPSIGEALQKYIEKIMAPFINDIKDSAKQTKIGAHIIWPTNYPLPTQDELKTLINNDGTPAKQDDFSTIVLTGSTNILMIPKSRPLVKNDADPLIPTIDVHSNLQPVIQHTVNQYGTLVAPSNELSSPEGAIPLAVGSFFPEGIPTSKMMDIIDLNFNVLYGWLGSVWQDGSPGTMNLAKITGVDDPIPGRLTTIETDHTGAPLECKPPRVTTPLLSDDCYLPGDMGFVIPLKDKNNTLGFLPLKTFQISPRNIATGFTPNEAARPPILGLNNSTFMADGSDLGGSLSTVLENVINTMNKLVFNKRCAETQLVSVPVSGTTQQVEIDWPITYDSVPFVPSAPFVAPVSGTDTLFNLEPFCLTTTGGKFSILSDTSTNFDNGVNVAVAITGMTIPQNYKDNIILDQGVKVEGVCGKGKNQSGLTTPRTTQFTISSGAKLTEEDRSF